MKKNIKRIIIGVCLCLGVTAIVWAVYTGMESGKKDMPEETVILDVQPGSGEAEPEVAREEPDVNEEQETVKAYTISADKIQVYYGCIYVPDSEVTFKEREEVYYTQDGNPILKSRYSYPYITRLADEEARDKINRYMEDAADDWFRAKEQEAKKYEQDYLESGEEFDFHWELESNRTITCGRVDPLIVSLLVTNYDFMGGIHGGSYSTGLSFDRNGELLTFDDICYDREQVVGSVKDYLFNHTLLASRGDIEE